MLISRHSSITSAAEKGLPEGPVWPQRAAAGASPVSVASAVTPVCAAEAFLPAGTTSCPPLRCEVVLSPPVRTSHVAAAKSVSFDADSAARRPFRMFATAYSGTGASRCPSGCRMNLSRPPVTVATTEKGIAPETEHGRRRTPGYSSPAMPLTTTAAAAGAPACTGSLPCVEELRNAVAPPKVAAPPGNCP